MNRRGFLQGLGALLATSAMVRPAAPIADVAWSTEPFKAAGWINSSVPPLPNGDYVSVVHPSILTDLKREWEAASYEMRQTLYGDGPTRHGLNKFKEMMIGSDRWPGHMYVSSTGDIEYRDDLSCCQFEADPDDEDEAYEDPWHYRRVCAHCNGVWFGLHCQHDGHQRPCPHCSIIPTPVQE